jgi:chemotaxis protein CheC
MFDGGLTNEKLNVLTEIGNIGAGNATTSLSVLLHNDLRMEMPVVKILEFDDIPELVGGAETVVSAVITHFTGDVSGMILFVLELEESKNLAGSMLNKKYDEGFTSFDHMDKSALKEVGNILMSSYLASISTLTNLEVHTEPPAICVDMAGSVLDLPLIELGQVADNALVIDSKFMDKDEPIDGFLMFVADDESYKKIFTSLGLSF